MDALVAQGKEYSAWSSTENNSSVGKTAHERNSWQSLLELRLTQGEVERCISSWRGRLNF